MSLLEVIDQRLKDIFYRSAIQTTELEGEGKLLDGLPVELTDRRQYHTRTEVVDLLLDARSVIMAQERTNEGDEDVSSEELQDELDTLVGADINTS